MESHLASLIGKVVLFRVTPPFVEEARFTLQLRNPTLLLYGKLLAVDGMGCWVENSQWTADYMNTPEPSTYLAHVLIPWAHIISAAVFPERAFVDLPNDQHSTSIGFLANL